MPVDALTPRLSEMVGDEVSVWRGAVSDVSTDPGVLG